MGFENGRLLRCAIRATKGDSQQVLTLHYDLHDSTYPAHDNDPQTLADLLRDGVRAQLATQYDAAWTMQPVEVVEEKDPQHPLAPRSAWISGAPIPGSNPGSGEQLPSACCVVAKLVTDTIGRRHTGRSFFGGTFRESAQTNGAWSSGVIATYVAILNSIPKEPDIAVGVSTSTAKWCVYSRTQRAANADPYASPVQSYTVRSRVHWLRSREGEEV
jgi:hypothetical protein